MRACERYGETVQVLLLFNVFNELIVFGE